MAPLAQPSLSSLASQIDKAIMNEIKRDKHLSNTIKQTLFLQIFGLVAFIKQKENDNISH